MSTRYRDGQTAFLESGVQPLETARVAAPTDDIGRGLMSLGASGARVFAEYTRVNDARELLEAEQDMQKAANDFAVFQTKNTNEKTWLPEWRRISGELEKRNGQRQLSADGRLSLAQGVGRWATNQTGRVQEQALKQTAARTLQAAKNTINAAIDNDDPDRAFGAIQLLETSGAAFPEQAEAMRQDLTRALKTKTAEKEFEELSMMATTNPAMARELADEGVKSSRISDLQRFKINEMADRQEQQNRTESFNTFRRRIGVGDLPSPDELKADASLTDLDRQELVTLATSQPSNDEELFQRQITAIGSMPSNAAPLERAKYEAFLEANFSGPHLDHLRSLYDARFASGGMEAVRTTEAFQALDRWAFDEQRLGSYKKPKLDAEGKPVFKKREGVYSLVEGWFSSSHEKQPDTFEPDEEVDPAAKDKVMTLVSQIKETLRGEISTGKLTDSAGVFRRMAELAKMPLTAKAASEVDPQMMGMPTSVSGSPSTPSLLPPADISEILKRHAQNPRK
jgi:hypothetical protein